MKLNITENYLKELIHSNIMKVLKEENEFGVNATPMQELEFICKHLMEYANFYIAILSRIPSNTENIINNLSNRLNELCQCEMSSLNYNENELVITFTGDFSSLTENQEYISDGNELYEYIGDYLGAYDKTNYGGNGVLEATVKNVSFDGGVYDSNYNKLNVNLNISPYINPYYLEQKLKH